jgi:hypothetical protein
MRARASCSEDLSLSMAAKSSILEAVAVLNRFDVQADLSRKSFL